MITTRPYQSDDWVAICRVHNRARPDELRGSCDPQAFVPLADDPTAASIHQDRKWVACDDDEIVGFVGVDGSYLAWLYVDPSHYGKGIGRRLLRLALGEMGVEAHTIVLEGNAAARALYASEGFVATGTFAGDNAGYPCTCVRLALRPQPRL